MPDSLRRMADYMASSYRLGSTVRDQWLLFWKQTKNIRVRLGLDSYHPEEIYVIRTIYGPLYFRDNFGDITNVLDLLYHQVYQPHKLQHPGAIIDVGANIGLAALMFHHFNPDRPLYCFEPLEENIELIKLNCPEAVVERVALGAEEGQASLQVDRDNVMASVLSCRWETEGEVFDVIPLDKYVKERGIDQIALLKVDAEGMELEILAGGRDVLERTHAVVMETHGVERHARAKLMLRERGHQLTRETFEGGTGIVYSRRESGLET